MKVLLVIVFLTLFYLSIQQNWVTCNLYTEEYWENIPTNFTRGTKIFQRAKRKFQPKYFLGKQNFKVRSKKTSQVPLNKINEPHQKKKYQEYPSFIPAECASFPENLINGDQRKVYIHTKRLTSVTSTKVLFIFGGPVGSSASFLDETLDYFYYYLEENFDVYTIENRGSGLSNRLGCETSQAETQGSEGGFTITDDELDQCGNDFTFHYPNNGTQGFSVSAAAQDALDIMNKVSEGKQIFVYGFSYGTYLLNRVIQINNNSIPIEGIALDSVFPASGTDQERFIMYNRDVQINNVVFSILEECKLDSFCYDMMTSSPSGSIFADSVENYVETVFEKAFVNETCIDILTNNYNATFWKLYMGYLSPIPDGRIVIPAILFRLDRCDIYDTTVLNYVGSVVQANNNLSPITMSLSSKVLERHIIYSELWGVNNIPTYDELLLRFENNLYFGIGSHDYMLGFNQWPTYTRDNYFNSSFSTTSPVLILSGKLDPLTPSYFADTVQKYIQSPNIYKYEIPYATHWTINTSPVHENNVSDIYCGFQLLINFLNNPNQQPDQSCLFNLLEIDWRGNVDSNLQYLGVEDLYNGIYEEQVERRTIDLYLFIAIYTGTCVILLSIIAMLIYYVFQLCAKVKDIDEEEDEEEFVEQE